MKKRNSSNLSFKDVFKNMQQIYFVSWQILTSLLIQILSVLPRAEIILGSSGSCQTCSHPLIPAPDEPMYCSGWVMLLLRPVQLWCRHKTQTSAQHGNVLQPVPPPKSSRPGSKRERGLLCHPTGEGFLGPELAGALGDCSERRRWGLRRAALLMATLPHRRLNKVSQPAEAPPTLCL